MAEWKTCDLITKRTPLPPIRNVHACTKEVTPCTGKLENFHEFPVTLQCLKILTLLAEQHVPTLTDAWNGLGIELCRPRLFEVRLLQRARMEYFELQSTVQKHCNQKTPTCNLHVPGFDARNSIQIFTAAPVMPALHIPQNWIKVAENG